MRVAITGGSGLIGWHIRCRLASLGYEVASGDRGIFGAPDDLERFLGGADAIVHAAGANRGPDEDVESTNIRLAEQLCDALRRHEATPHIIFTNSVQSSSDNPYGRSKRLAAERFTAWAEEAGALFTDLVLPHVFGECGRPFHNSVVSTFCHQLANGDDPKVLNDSQLELFHAQDVANIVESTLRVPASDQIRPSGDPTSVTALLERLKRLHDTYGGHRVPDLRDPLDLRLFNTLRSYLYPNSYPVQVPLHTDARGNLFEAVKSEHGGQAFLSTTHPGITRGNHFHFDKFERFLVVRGEATIRVRRLFMTDIEEFHVSGEQPQYVDMPTLHTHNITNTGRDDLITLFWSHELFDPEHPDTIAEDV